MKLKSYLCMAGLLLVMLFVVTACGGYESKPKPTEVSDPMETADAESDSNSMKFRGIIKGIENGTENNTVTLYNLDYDNDIQLVCSVGTSVYNANETLTTINSLEPGCIVNVTYNPATLRAVTVMPEPDAWSYNDIVNWSVDVDKHVFTIADTKYQFNSTVMVLNDGKTQDIMCLNSVDKLKVYGIGKKIHSIIVEEGHGYIRPANYDDFVGGTVSVGYILNKPVSEDMLLVVREGKYEVTMKNGSLSGTKMVEVLRDQESLLDMNEFKSVQGNSASVSFDITPQGADLYINGRITDYSEPVSLNYGDYEVVVSLTGYTTYSGVLSIQSPNPTVNINLSEEVADIDENVADNQNTSDNNTTGNGTSSTTASESDGSSAKYDKEHSIIINAPEGAEVYLNGTYKGVVPCAFPKQIGTQTITLSKSGYKTQSYTVVISDDSQDISWNFPELSAE